MTPAIPGNGPAGARFIEWLSSRCCRLRRLEPNSRLNVYRSSVLALTYLAYTCYHMTRKTISVVKNELYQNCSNMTIPPDIYVNDSNRDTWCDWAPFDTPDAPALLGTLDSAFLFSYAAAMFISGFIAERVNLRYFLTIGMLGSGIFTALFGFAKIYDIHNLWYFITVQILSGIFQTSGWPGVVTVVGNWFGKSKRGLLFGIWNSHTSLGNIMGTLIPSAFEQINWGYSFIVPGAIMIIVGFVIFLFLVSHPIEVGCVPPQPYNYRRLDATHSSDSSSEEDVEGGLYEDRDMQQTETTPILSVNQRPINSTERAIGLWGACKIPGVIEYSFSLFFAKLVSYTFLFWLPMYIKTTTPYKSDVSARLSTLFDVGGIFGAIIAGFMSDWSGMSATTCGVMLFFSIPTLFVYKFIGNINLLVNASLLTLAGVLVNGPYALITTAVAADLGTHPSLGENSKALATVTAIIDGTGSIGAAVGPLLAGFISSRSDLITGWIYVYFMLMISEVFALAFLSKLVGKELKIWLQRRRVL